MIKNEVMLVGFLIFGISTWIAWFFIRDQVELVCPEGLNPCKVSDMDFERIDTSEAILQTIMFAMLSGSVSPFVAMWIDEKLERYYSARKRDD